MMLAQKEAPEAGQTAGANNIMLPLSQDDDRKLFANLAARAMTKGHQLSKTPGGYMLSRWQHSRHVDDLATVDVLLQRMGA